MAAQQNPFDIKTGSTTNFVAGPAQAPGIIAGQFAGVQGPGGAPAGGGAQAYNQKVLDDGGYMTPAGWVPIDKSAGVAPPPPKNDHWSYYGATPLEAAANRAAGQGPMSQAEWAAAQNARNAAAPAAPAPAAPSTSPFVIGGVPTGTPNMAAVNPPPPAPAPGGGGAGTGGAGGTGTGTGTGGAGGSTTDGSSSTTTGFGSMDAPPTAAATGWNPTNWNVANDQTVEGRLQGILAQNSPLLQKAQADALIAANGRGMLNSSMAQGAATAAVMDKALQIATPDAQTAAAAGQFNAGARNEASRDFANATNAMTNANADRSFERSKMEYSARVNDYMAKLEGGIRRDLAILDGDIKKQLASVEAQFKTQMQTSQSAATMYGEALRSIGQIMTDPNLDAAAKQNAINQQMSALTNGLRLQTAIGNIPGLNDLLASIGQEVQVDLGGGAAPAPAPGQPPAAYVDPNTGLPLGDLP